MDSNHRRHSQQIYSLPPLATWVTYQSRLKQALIPMNRAAAVTSGKKSANRLTTDGKWRAFPQVPHLLQHIRSGTHFCTNNNKEQDDSRAFGNAGLA